MAPENSIPTFQPPPEPWLSEPASWEPESCPSAVVYTQLSLGWMFISSGESAKRIYNSFLSDSHPATPPRDQLSVDSALSGQVSRAMMRWATVPMEEQHPVYHQEAFPQNPGARSSLETNYHPVFLQNLVTRMPSSHTSEIPGEVTWMLLGSVWGVGSFSSASCTSSGMS